MTPTLKNSAIGMTIWLIGYVSVKVETVLLDLQALPDLLVQTELPDLLVRTELLVLLGQLELMVLLVLPDLLV